MQTKKTHASDVAKRFIEISAALVLFVTFWRLCGLPVYRYVAAKWELPEPIETGIAVVFVVVSLGFAVLATVKLMKIVHTRFLT